LKANIKPNGSFGNDRIISHTEGIEFDKAKSGFCSRATILNTGNGLEYGLLIAVAQQQQNWISASNLAIGKL
jgi:hypothetical protein